MDISGVFDDISAQMRRDFEKARKAIVAHSGMKGAAFEDTVRGFLENHLPSSLAVCTGQLFDSTGAQSNQLDVIIYDRHATPVLYRTGEIQVIPIECAYAVIEVKAQLSPSTIPGIIENMLSVRKLVKSACYWFSDGEIILTRHNLYGQEWDIWPVHYFVFAFESSEVDAIGQRITDEHESRKLPLPSRIDCVCILDRAVFLNRHPDGSQDALPGPDTTFAYYETPKALLLFYTLIAHYLNQATLPRFRFSDYIKNVNWGDQPAQAAEPAQDAGKS